MASAGHDERLHAAPLLPTSSSSPSTRATHHRSHELLASRLHRHRSAVAAVVVSLLLVATVILSVTLPPPPALTSAPTIRDAVAPIVSQAFPAKPDGTRDMLQFCDEKFVTQELDHFRANGGGGTFEQRYFVCSRETFDPATGAIFFYVGNEADVELYLNNTGLMWENAAAFNALVVFAEHRYFGKSVPFGAKVLEHMEFLSSTQALADFAVLVEHLKDSLAVDVPVVGFGGSYGGMLGTWFRLKYPHIVDGVIAASAPILAFMGDRKHPVDTEGFHRGVTFDMSEQAGAAPNCIANVRRAFARVLQLGKTAIGRRELADVLRVCESNALDAEADVAAVVNAVVDAYGNLAMGNYPYASSYMTSDESFLPAYPVRTACEHLKGDFVESDTPELLAAFRESFAVFLNSTKREPCFFPAPPAAVERDEASATRAIEAGAKGNLYAYIECAELYAPFSCDGVRDAFPVAPVDLVGDDAACFAQWNVRIRLDWTVTEYGGLEALRAASNIVFSNGNFDPWSKIGVTKSVSDSVVYVPIEGGAHHLDLFFTHPLDPPSVTQAREVETQHIRKWIDEFYAREASAPHK